MPKQSDHAREVTRILIAYLESIVAINKRNNRKREVTKAMEARIEILKLGL